MSTLIEFNKLRILAIQQPLKIIAKKTTEEIKRIVIYFLLTQKKAKTR